ncbi:MAG: LytTR family DNA-binding domain-containing protein [Bacteroidia bacterium]
MIRSIIVEDEKKNRDTILKMFEEYFPNIEVLAVCDTTEKGKAAIEQYKPDLAFLDVELPPNTSFQMLEQIGQINFEVIFTTAYDKYALQAIRNSALDYLLKPFTVDDMKQALQRYEEKTNKQNTAMQFQNLFHNLKHSNTTEKKIALSTFSGLTFVPVKNIVRCQADANYTTFYLLDKTKIVVSKTLKEYEELLKDYNFFRVHQSNLINLEHIKNYVRGEGGTVFMTDGSEIDVSRRKKDEFMKKLHEM